jgi:NAD(P)-dependent dehydrogenase (short-subunit alcohol dehydrogenase family)
VALADVNEDLLSSVAGELSAARHTALAVRCKVADESHAAALIEAAVSEFGQLDYAFNAAGIQVPSSDAADDIANTRSAGCGSRSTDGVRDRIRPSGPDHRPADCPAIAGPVGGAIGAG